MTNRRQRSPIDAVRRRGPDAVSRRQPSRDSSDARSCAPGSGSPAGTAEATRAPSHGSSPDESAGKSVAGSSDRSRETRRDTAVDGGSDDSFVERRGRSSDEELEHSAGHRSDRSTDEKPGYSADNARKRATDDGGGGRNSAIDRPTRPDWLADDGVVGGIPDRQVLVAGDGIPGLTLTALLDRAGYDPVLVAGGDGVAEPAVTLLWPPSLRVLDALGVGAAVRDGGAVVDGVAVRRADGADGRNRSTVLSRRPDASVAAPLVVETAALRRRLLTGTSAGERVQDREVAGLARRGDARTVEFDDGVREWFDVVALAGTETAGLDLGDADPVPSVPLRQYEIPVDARSSGTADTRVLDSWLPAAIAQFTPHPDESGGMLRITAPGSDHPAAAGECGRQASVDAVRGLASPSGSRLPEPTTVRQTRLRRGGVEPRWWGSGRVPRCGQAAVPVAGATGLAVSLGIEDAWVFAAALGTETGAVPDAVRTYAARRARWLRALAREVAFDPADSSYPVPGRASSSAADGSATGLPTTAALHSVARLRAVALGAFTGPSLAELQGAVADWL